jgi:hypothetical protein
MLMQEQHLFMRMCSSLKCGLDGCAYIVPARRLQACVCVCVRSGCCAIVCEHAGTGTALLCTLGKIVCGLLQLV